MIIRWMSADDDPREVSRIYAKSWRSAYRGIVPQDYLDTLADDRWADKIVDKGILNLLLISDGIPVGTASISRSRWEEYPDAGEVIALYLLPEYTGMGYGRSLLKRCVAELIEAGYRRILLWVFEDNLRARNFYECCGFVDSGITNEITISGKALTEKLYFFENDQ